MEKRIEFPFVNEILFFLHAFVVLGFILVAVRLGKEALIVWVAIQALLANLFVLKQITFFGFYVTCSDVFAIGCITSLNLLQEYYGKKSAKQAIWISFFVLLFYALMSQFHLLYIPAAHDTTQSSFINLLGITPRLLLASLTTFFLVQQIDLHFFRFLKKRLSSLPFATRSTISLISSQLFDTVFFSFLGLYGLGFALFDIIVVSFLLKVIVIACTFPIHQFSKKVSL